MSFLSCAVTSALGADEPLNAPPSAASSKTGCNRWLRYIFCYTHLALKTKLLFIQLTLHDQHYSFVFGRKATPCNVCASSSHSSWEESHRQPGIRQTIRLKSGCMRLYSS